MEQVKKTEIASEWPWKAPELPSFPGAEGFGLRTEEALAGRARAWWAAWWALVALGAIGLVRQELTALGQQALRFPGVTEPLTGHGHEEQVTGAVVLSSTVQLVGPPQRLDRIVEMSGAVPSHAEGVEQVGRLRSELAGHFREPEGELVLVIRSTRAPDDVPGPQVEDLG